MFAKFVSAVLSLGLIGGVAGESAAFGGSRPGEVAFSVSQPSRAVGGGSELVLAGKSPEAGRTSQETSFAWPLPDPVTVARPFDPPDEKWLAGHRGVDLTERSGSAVFGEHQPVLAPADGVVTFNGFVVNRQVLVISHGELRSTLEPVVGGPSVGATVKQGEVVGLVASGQEQHCPGCLHWGVRRGEDYLDPASLVVPRNRAVLWQ